MSIYNKIKIPICSLIFLTLLCFISCIYDHVDSRNIKITNKTSKAIYCFHSNNDRFPFKSSNFTDKEMERFRIDTGCTAGLYNKPRYWEDFMVNADGYKCRVLIFSIDTIEKYGWEEVTKKSNFVKRYLLNLEDIKNINWQIIYDGN